MPSMDAAKRGTDPRGNRPGDLKPVWCWLCQPGTRTLVGRYRTDRLNTAAHEHIDRAHQEQE